MELRIGVSIGLPGDAVVCCDDSGRLTVNGQPLDESAYLYTDPSGVQAEVWSLASTSWSLRVDLVGPVEPVIRLPGPRLTVAAGGLDT